MIEWNWAESGRQLGQLLFAFLLTLPIAWNRERADRVMGLRSFPLVAMASCGFMLLAQSAFAGNVEAQARVLQGIITGIGFIGAAVALGRYEIAVLLALADFLILRYLSKLKHDD